MSQPNEVLTVNDPRLDEKAYRLEVLVGVFFPLSTIAMVLRLYTRFERHTAPATDDYLAILAYVIWVVWVALSLWAGQNGGGWPATSLPLQYNEIQAKVLYTAPILTASLMTAAKLSILTLYLRLFRPSRSFRIQSWIAGALCMLWWLAAVFATIFQCDPIKAGWNVMARLNPSTKCADFRAFVVGIEIPNAILDYVVAAMAIQVVRHLQMRLVHKIGLVIMFLLCTVVAFIGLFRIALTYNPRHYSIWSQFEWLAVQNAFVIICCCLPTYGVFLTKLGNPFDSVAGFFRSLSDRFSISNQEDQSQRSKSESTLADQRIELGSITKGNGTKTSIASEVVRGSNDTRQSFLPDRVVV